MDKNNFSWLLMALLIFLIAVPIANDLAVLSRPVIRALALCCLVLIGVWSMRGSGRPFTISIAFVITVVVFNSLAAKLSSPIYL